MHPSGDVGQAAEERARARQARLDLRPLAMLGPYLARHKPMVAAAGVAMLLAALATLAVPLGVRPMIDHGFSAENAAAIDSYFLIMMGLGVLLALASAARFFFVNWLGERLVADLRADVFTHLTRLSPAFYEKTHSGEVMSRLTADTTQIKAALATSASQAVRNLIMVVGAVAMMMISSPKLSALVVLAIPVIVLPVIAYGRAVRSLSRRAQDRLADASAFAAENLSAVRTLQAFTYEQTARQRFIRSVERAFQAARDRMVARAGLTALAITLTFASIIGILWYGAHEVLAGHMTAGTLGQFVLYALFAAGAMGGLVEVWGEVQQTAGAAERLAELLRTQPQIRTPRNPQSLPQPVHGALAFEHVGFAYASRAETPALRDISFATRPGETLAIVGPSGAGKSTLFALLLRFYDPASGQITLDGVPISRLRLADLRRQIALVPQDVAMFADTVAENIRYGAPEATRAQIEEAARAAQALDFIRALPEGLDTRLGERGVQLSGGQRQRIAIARAILRDAPVLLLDEATSALDSESEARVQQALETVMDGRTTLVIAHRLATVKAAHRILVLEDGRITEQGRHDELVAKGGTYARLSRLQFQTQETAG